MVMMGGGRGGGDFAPASEDLGNGLVEGGVHTQLAGAQNLNQRREGRRRSRHQSHSCVPAARPTATVTEISTDSPYYLYMLKKYF